MQAEDPKIEEQSVWNRMMRDEFERVGSGNVVDEIMARRCLVFRHKPTGRDVRIWPLNPNLFPNHPLYVKAKQSEVVLEPPFIVHYNWLYGIAAKENEMKGNGHWLIPEQ